MGSHAFARGGLRPRSAFSFCTTPHLRCNASMLMSAVGPAATLGGHSSTTPNADDTRDQAAAPRAAQLLKQVAGYVLHVDALHKQVGLCFASRESGRREANQGELCLLCPHTLRPQLAASSSEPDSLVKELHRLRAAALYLLGAFSAVCGRRGWRAARPHTTRGGNPLPTACPQNNSSSRSPHRPGCRRSHKQPSPRCARRPVQRTRRVCVAARLPPTHAARACVRACVRACRSSSNSSGLMLHTWCR